MPSDVKVTIPCKLGWTKLKGYNISDNKSSNTGIKLQVEISQSINISSLDFTRTVTESSREQATKMGLETTATATYGVVEASVSASIENSTIMKDLLSSTKEVTRKEDYTYTKTYKDEFTIGSGDQLYFYQRVFKGPGLFCALEVTEVSSNPKLEDVWTDITMTVTARPQRFIKSLDVVYGDLESHSPGEYIREISGKPADINKGHKGKYVWLVPVWTFEAKEAATGFEIRIQEKGMAGWKDLAKDAGGDYRYVAVVRDEYNPQKIVEAKLIRNGDQILAEKQVEMLGKKLGSKGWVGGVRDINEGRGGDWLYLAYRLY
ncbi:hypothetical protein QBC38DRAFT_531944 [Podospora fimiseda]|uniref:Uncharacterized protein n=1 Tax=Podospora fimiseda TaxID=252190 RepID=A0AAN7BKE7_9PEZI|nr:hypothetical protein QBC38DRAFT_531944 [Podospora fimiseda]